MHRKYNLVSVKQISYGSTGRYSGMESLDRRNSYVLSQSASDDKFSLNFTPNDLTFCDSVKFEWIIE